MANHININTSFNLRYDPSGQVSGAEAHDEDNPDEPEELDWKWVDVDFSDDVFTKTLDTTVPAVNVPVPPKRKSGRAGACGGTHTSNRNRLSR